MEENDIRLTGNEKDYYKLRYFISDEKYFIDNNVINSFKCHQNGRSFTSIKYSPKITPMNIIETRMKQEPDSLNYSEESMKLLKSYPIDLIEARIKQEPDTINYCEESMKLFKSYPINSSNDKTSSTKIEKEEMEFIEDTRDVFKLPIDYRDWNERNLKDWFYWIRHKLRFKYPKIPKDIIDLKTIEIDDLRIWETKYDKAAESMYKYFILWVKYKNLKMKPDCGKIYGSECINVQTEKPRRRNEKKDGLYLWQILLTMLLDSNCSEYIAWTDIRNGMFKIKNPNAVSIIWGESKGNKNMTYDKMSRSMRQYYKTKLLKKTTHDKLNYCFNMDDNSVKKFITRCRDKLPDIRIPPDLHQRSSS